MTPKQRRIEAYLNPPQRGNQSRAYLPTLPTEIRSRIYDYCGFEDLCHLHLNLADPSEDAKEDVLEEDETEDSPCQLRTPWIRCTCNLQKGHNNCFHAVQPPMPPIQLLLVCRSMYSEVCKLFYGRNHFRVSRARSGGFTGVLNLGTLALRSLTSLAISLNQRDSPHLYQEFDTCATCLRVDCDRDDLHERDMVPPLSCVSRSDQHIIREWAKLCEHLGRHITPSCLKLRLVFNAANFETAQKVLHPLINLPTLSACAISLSPDSNPDLRGLVETTCRRLTGRSSSRDPPSYLPPLSYDIISQIFQYTDLVAPHDLLWTPDRGLFCRSHSPKQVLDEDFAIPRDLQPRNPCEVCYGSTLLCEMCEKALGRPEILSECSCWRFPFQLFQLNREYNLLATRTFYSSNKFYVMFDENLFSDAEMECASCEIIWKPYFIRRLPLKAIPYLRSIRFVIAQYNDAGNYINFVHEDAPDWPDDISILARHANKSQLTITIDESPWRKPYYPYINQSSSEDDDLAFKRDQRIVKPFLNLRGLRDFFVILDHPWSRSKEPRFREARERRERYLERSIMGPHYDSAKRGKLVD